MMPLMSTTSRRVDTLRTILLEQAAEAVQGSVQPDRGQIVDWITSATSLAINGQSTAVTIEGALPLRSGFDAIARCLTLLTIRHLGCKCETLVDFHRDHPLAEFRYSVGSDDTASWGLVSHLRKFYLAVTDWLTDGYEVRNLHRTFLNLCEDERARFATERMRFAELITSLASDPLLEEDFAHWEGEIPTVVSELKVLRGLAQASAAAAGNAHHPDSTDAGEADVDSCVSVLVPIFPASRSGDETLMLVSFERDRVHFWARQNRSRLWYRTARLIAGQALRHTNRTLIADLDAVIAESDGGTGLCFESLRDSIETVSIIDLSSKNVPLSLLEDDGGRLAFAMSCSQHPGREPLKQPRVSFWGLMQNLDGIGIDVDDQMRRMQWDSPNGRTELRHPAVPDPESIRFTTGQAPLLLSQFEYWDLEDHLHSGQCSLDSVIGSDATRTEFLEHDWRETDVLHLATHAVAMAGTPEYGHLEMFPDSPGTGVVHSFDILSLDLSNLRLVFLNACRTKLGSQWTGNEDLSLAWAFRAAGAKAVIAMRWDVSDVAAWYFSNRFYDAWLGSPDTSVRSAFRTAQQAVRGHPHFGKPNLWGPFVLLD